MFTIHELHEYSDRVRTNFANKLTELPWSEVEKNREASFNSMKNILLHMIDNEEWMVNWVIRNKSKDYVRKKSEEYTSMKMILDHLEEVEDRSRQYFAKLDDGELSRGVKLTTSAGQTFDLSVEECLFQSFTEQMYHLGELIALLWQDNVEPPKMQWFWNNPRVQTSTNPSAAASKEKETQKFTLPKNVDTR
jgi:uncharacterized damage-inducible protein DinB